MEYIKWHDDYSVNVKEIDDQHKHLIGILNRTYIIIQSNKKDDLKKIIDEIFSYAKMHFGVEEKYFKEFDYIGADAHIAEHRKLLKKIVEFMNRKDDDPMTVGLDILDFLEDWLVDHVAYMDKKYTACFNDHGLA